MSLKELYLCILSSIQSKYSQIYIYLLTEKIQMKLNASGVAKAESLSVYQYEISTDQSK